jgi:signal transduction histidine kinase/ligand-binding sensor domain-containing protein/CheY-like chemotaxis protein
MGRYHAAVNPLRCSPRRAVLGMMAFALMVSGICPRPAHGFDLKKIGGRLVKQSWQPEQGLPQVSVTAILHARDGYVWVGTFGGAARFDGVRFTVFDAASTPPLAGSRVRALFEDRDGAIWIGTESGLSRWAGGRVTSYTVADGLPADLILSIAQDAAGRVWVGTGLGIAAIDKGEVVHGEWEQAARRARTVLIAGRDGAILAMNGHRFLQLRDSRLTEQAAPRVVAHDVVTSMFDAADGSLWVAFEEAAFRRSPDGSWNEVKGVDGLTRIRSAFVTGDNDGRILIASGNKLLWWQDGGIVHVEAPIEMAADGFRVAIEDDEGRLWLGTNRSGLLAWHAGRARSLGTADGLFDTTAVAVIEDRAGTLWVSAGCEGLYQIVNGAGRRYADDRALASSCVRTFAEDAAGDLWIGSIGSLSRLTDGKVVAQHSLPDIQPNALFPAADGTVWIGTSRGLLRFAGGRLETVDIGGPADNAVNFITQDRAGAIWVGARGLIRIANGEQRRYSNLDGMSNAEVRAIHEDADGVLWIGTYGGGLNRLKNERFTNYATDKGLLDNTVSRIIEDEQGYLWLNGNAGISRIAKQELNNVAEGRASSLDVVLYGTAHGMKTREGNGGTQPAGWRSRDGRLWMPTVRGIVELNPSVPAPPPLTVAIEEVLANDLPQHAGGPLRIGPGVNELTLVYTALAFNNPAGVRFKVRLEGYDDDWVDVGTRRQAFYTNLEPGRYRFRVIARNSGGVWNNEGASLDVLLLPYLYQTTWFLAVVGLTIIAMGWGAYRFSVRHLRERTLALTRLVKQRSEAEEALRRSNAEVEAALDQLHHAQQNLVQQERLRALGQMASGIAHDINNALAPVLGYSELLLKDTASDRRDEIDKLKIINTAAKDAASVVRRLVEFHRRRPEGSTFPPIQLHDLVLSVISLSRPRWESEARASGATIIVDTELQPVPPLPADESELREALINIVFNAVEAMPHGGTLQFKTRTEGEVAVLTVSDTGVGMTEEVRLRCFEPFFSTRGARGTGLGLSSVFGTVQRLNGTISVVSEPGKGTTFTILLPVGSVTADGEPAPGHLPSVVSRRVFLVEDEPLVRELMVEFLRADGHRVDTAENGLQGLAMFSPGAYDLVLTDRAMPLMGGDQMAAEIRRMDPAVPIILLSGFGDIMKATGDMPEGVTLVIGKPVTMNTLRAAIAEACRPLAAS